MKVDDLWADDNDDDDGAVVKCADDESGSCFCNIVSDFIYTAINLHEEKSYLTVTGERWFGGFVTR